MRPDATDFYSLNKNRLEVTLENNLLESYERKWREKILGSDFVKSYNETGSQDHEIYDLDEHRKARTRSLMKLIYPNTNLVASIQPKNVNRKCHCGLYNKGQNRIIDGVAAIPHQFPWMVSIQLRRGNVPFCGASIISNYYVLTAAHCTKPWSAEDLQVRVGDHDLTANDVSREVNIMVQKIIEHE
ncbi:CLIP domain-containing serine protease, partial [Halocaridina rubra]